MQESIIFKFFLIKFTISFIVLIKGIEWLKVKKYSKHENTDYSMDKI